MNTSCTRYCNLKREWKNLKIISGHHFEMLNGTSGFPILVFSISTYMPISWRSVENIRNKHEFQQNKKLLRMFHIWKSSENPILDVILIIPLKPFSGIKHFPKDHLVYYWLNDVTNKMLWKLTLQSLETSQNKLLYISRAFIMTN